MSLQVATIAREMADTAPMRDQYIVSATGKEAGPVAGGPVAEVTMGIVERAGRLCRRSRLTM